MSTYQRTLLSDRRNSARYKSPAVVSVVINGAEFPAELRNLSEDGLSFSLNRQLDMSKRHFVHVAIQSKEVEFLVRIRWIKETSGLYVHGAFFSTVSEEQTAQEFLNHLHIHSSSAQADRRLESRRQFAKDPRKSERPSTDRRYLKGNGKPHTLRRVVVTGVGTTSPIGIGNQKFFESIKNSTSGLRKINRFKDSAFKNFIGGEVDTHELNSFLKSNLDSSMGCKAHKLVRRTDRSAQFAIAAAIDAIKDAKLDFQKISHNAIGVAVGSSSGGLEFAFKEHDAFLARGVSGMHPYAVAACSPNSCSGEIAAEFKVRGPTASFSQGCTSGAIAISFGFEQIQRGKATAMLVGGTDTPFQESTFGAFVRSGMMASDGVSNPLDRTRDGIMLAEGAGILVLEDLEHAEQRGANIYAELTSESNTCDGHEMIQWRWHGEASTRAIKLAMEESELQASDLSVIFAHATGSKDGDAMEIRALAKAFGPVLGSIPIANIKGLTGYSQAACAPLEVIASCLAFRHSVIPGFPSMDESIFGLNVSRQARPANIDSALVNCFGFGGKNITLVLRRHEA